MLVCFPDSSSALVICATKIMTWCGLVKLCFVGTPVSGPTHFLTGTRAILDICILLMEELLCTASLWQCQQSVFGVISLLHLIIQRTTSLLLAASPSVTYIAQYEATVGGSVRRPHLETSSVHTVNLFVMCVCVRVCMLIFLPCYIRMHSTHLPAS